MTKGASDRIRTACRAALYGSASLLAFAPIALLLAPARSWGETISGTVPSVARSAVGAKGADGPPAGTGQDGNPAKPGNTPADLSVELDTTAVVTGGGIQMSSTGGAGGNGGGAGDGEILNGGAGGAGAAAGNVTLQLDSGSQVQSSVSTGGIAIGGAGGAGGDGGERANFGRTGAPGSGGSGGKIIYAQITGSVTSTYSGAPGVALVSVGGNGADAGDAITALEEVHAVAGGAGGAGGLVSTTPLLIGGSITSAGPGLVALSQGGDGGQGGDAADASGAGKATAGDGGAGGNGGQVDLYFSQATISGTGAVGRTTGPTVDFGNGTSVTLSNMTSGISAQSIGGTGAVGGQTGGAGKDGNGGNAGSGGDVGLIFELSTVQTSGYGSTGVLAQSIGGAAGGGASSQGFFKARPGTGGDGGAAGAVSINFSADDAAGEAVITRGNNSDAVVAQSLGGGGGYGGDITVIHVAATIGIGGLGGTGGSSNDVSVTNGNSTTGFDGLTISTHGDSSSGILAQSIAGGGGRGGNAFAVDLVGVSSVAVGGAGGSGGVAGTVNVDNNNAAIQTRGAHSSGIIAQSIGGGGGFGGGANSVDIGVQATVAVSVGGTGGTGEAANDVTTHNSGQIATIGSDSYGILAQSIAGAGGVGGASVASTYEISDAEAPSFDMKVSVGGSGGVGGSTGIVTAINDGYIWTQGAGSTGILAQSISGGGGAGGDSGTKGDQLDASDVTVDTSVGGRGAGAGSANSVNVTNTGVIVTLGKLADGIDAESIGGGGGNGGFGKSNSAAVISGDDDDVTIKLTADVGGKGGSGGLGGNVTVTNTQGILTVGDSSNGIFAASIGGGGGNAGAGIANGSGGKISVTLGIGGSGGNGNTSGTVTVNNSGGIVTAGGSANAIFAQSIGGGGGTGGNGSTNGSTDPETTVFNFIASGAGVGAKVVQTADGVYAIKDQIWGDFDITPKLLNMLDGYEESGPEAPLPDPEETEHPQWNITVGAGYAGPGGSGNSAKAVNVTNTGNLVTQGPDAVGILAQSIGGGGGSGGMSDVESPNSVRSPPNVPSILYSVGGAGGAGGDGGAVTVISRGGSIQTGYQGVDGVTTGDLSFGIEAQSIGGGGGNGGVSTTRGGTISDFTIGLGGNGGATGNGSSVSVSFDPTTICGSTVTCDNITTLGADAIGIVAQSIGGGGGVSKMLSVVIPEGGKAGASQTALPSFNVVKLRLNGSGGAGGSGLDVTVNLGTNGTQYGYLQTEGQNAYGVLAQSIGGGGGLQLGMGVGDTAAAALQSMMKDVPASNAYVIGDGGPVAVNLDHGFNIGTYGDGAAGILAQSIGGGGAIFGGLTGVNLYHAAVATPSGVNRIGQGGDVTVTLTGSAAVATRGVGAPAILAQSLGGGGGILADSDGNGFVFASTTKDTICGDSCTGRVNVTVDSGSVVEASGKGGYGIYAQSHGNGANDVIVTVGSGSFVRAVSQAQAAILVDGQDSNTINIQAGAYVGHVDVGMNDDPSGIAIVRPSGTVVNVDNAGKLVGISVALPAAPVTSTSTDLLTAAGAHADSSGAQADAAGSASSSGALTINNLPGGVMVAGGAFDLGATGKIVNNGTFDIGGGKVGQTTVNGSFIQGDGGKLLFDADFEKGQADKLVVNGTAQMGGSISIRATTLAKTPVTLIQATELLPAGQPVGAAEAGTSGATRGMSTAAVSAPAADSPAQVTGTHLYSYSVQIQGSSLVVTPQANFVTDTSLLNTTQTGLTKYLQRIWDGGQAGFGTSFAELGKINTAQEYASTVKRLTGEGLNAVNTMRLLASYSLVSDLQACGRVNSVKELSGDECTWSRLAVTGVNRSRDSEFVGFGMTMLTAEFGFRREISSDWFVGVTGAYEHSDLHTNDSLVHVEGNSALAAVSLMHRMGAWRASLAADVGYGWYDGKRQVGLDDALTNVASSPGSSNVGLHGRLSYDLVYKRFYLRPQMDLEVNWLRTGGYQEHGSDLFDLTTQTSSQVVVSATPALEIGTEHTLKNGGSSRLYAVAGLTGFGNDDWVTKARFTSAPAASGTFRSELNNPAVAGRFGLGAQWQVADRLDIGLEYDAHVASHIMANSGILRANYHF